MGAVGGVGTTKAKGRLVRNHGQASLAWFAITGASIRKGASGSNARVMFEKIVLTAATGDGDIGVVPRTLPQLFDNKSRVKKERSRLPSASAAVATYSPLGARRTKSRMTKRLLIERGGYEVEGSDGA